MTLEEAIRHAEEVVKEQEEASKRWKRWKEYKDRGIIGWSNSNLASVEKSIESCDKCAAEHRQLAEWLKELKAVHDEIDNADDEDEIFTGKKGGVSDGSF